MKVILLLITGASAVYLFHAWQVLGSQEDMLFIGADITEDRIDEVNSEWNNTEELYLETEDGEILHGWIQHAGTTPAPLLMYFGGNAEEASAGIEQYDIPDDWSVLFMNYRSYGNSSGEPEESTLFKDALLLYDYASSHEKVKESRIAVMGRSMGTAPAAHTARNRDPAGVILISPYDSREELQSHRYPYLPISAFIRHPFEVSNMAEQSEAPLLGITASEDRVIPPDHSYVTFNNWNGDVHQVELEGFGHNSLHQSRDFHDEIKNFLSEIESS
ncbi:MAG: hypothetical protein EA344_11125 [Alkalicoccus sp.]|nr:MAG: hypothetical protein EA344_11125 [Alkalicoccus sp.]